MVAFVVHFSTIAYDLKHPKHPSIRIRKTDLRNIDFPVNFKFCIGDVRNNERFHKLGYVNRFNAFIGSSMFNRSLVGWNGHTQNFSTLMSVRGKGIILQAQCLFILIPVTEFIQNVSSNWTDIVLKIKMKSLNLNGYWTVPRQNITWSPLQQYPNCQLFDPARYWNLKNISTQSVKFYFLKKANVSVSLHVEDKRRSLAKRNLKSQTTSQGGTEMFIQNSNLGEYRRFYLSISQKRDLEMDPGVSCTKYPTDKFSSYQDCDESFVYDLMKNIYKIMPFWAARKLDEVTQSGSGYV